VLELPCVMYAGGNVTGAETSTHFCEDPVDVQLLKQPGYRQLA